MSNHLYAKFNGGSKVYPIRDGAVLTSCYNEELDTAEIILDHVLSSNVPDIQRLDLVEIVFNVEVNYVITTKTLYRFLIDKITKENIMQLGTSSENYYKITIGLMSETKQLENVILPNLAITQNLNGTGKTVAYYIQKYIDDYGETKRIGGLDNVNFFSKDYDIDITTSNFFSNTCPEMQWNNPTLREVLTDLMLTKDCIPVLKNHVISYISLTDRKEEIDHSNINYVKDSQTCDDYVSDIYSSIENVMQTNVKDVDNTVNVCEYTGFRCDGDSDFILTDENQKLVLNNPIIRIKKAIITLYPRQYCWFGTPSTNNNDGFCKYDFDITDLIKEKSEYATMPIYYGPNPTPENLAYDTYKTYQNLALYYERGSNVITGFGVKTSTLFSSETELKSLIICLARMKTDSAIGTVRSAYTYTDFNDKFFDTSLLKYIGFRIEYETQANCLAVAGRYLPIKHKKVSNDNQTNSYVDAYRQGIFEYSKVDRLGNEVSLIHGRYDNFDDIPSLASTYNNKVIYKKEVSYERNCYEVDMYCTENYVLRDYFTGVRSKVRSWAIASSDEAILRHDIQKTYLEFSFSLKDEAGFNSSDSNNICDYFLSPLKYDSTISTINACVYTSEIEGNNVKDLEYQIDLVSRIFGRSLLFTAKATDNYEIGRGIIESDSHSINNTYKYTDSNGNDDGYIISFYDNVVFSGYGDNGQIISPDLTYVFANTLNNESNLKNIVGEKVKINDVWEYVENGTKKNLRFSFQTNRHKDQRETTCFTAQYEFCADTTDIYIGKRFLEMQKAVYLKPKIASYSIPSASFQLYDDTLYQEKAGLPTADEAHSNYRALVAQDTTYSISYPSKTTTCQTLHIYNCVRKESGFEWNDEGQYTGGTIFTIKGKTGDYIAVQQVENSNSSMNKITVVAFKINGRELYIHNGKLKYNSFSDTPSISNSYDIGKLMLVGYNQVYISTKFSHNDNDVYNNFFAFNAKNGDIFTQGSTYYYFYNGELLPLALTSYKIYGSYSDNHFGQQKDNNLADCVEIGNSSNISIEGVVGHYSHKIVITGLDNTLCKSFAITDGDDNILLAWNGTAKTIYLNALKQHNDYLYDATKDKIVGTIIKKE